MERFSYPGGAFFNVKMTHLGIDTFLHVHSPQKQINKLKIYAVAGYVVILPDTAPEKVFPLQDLATMATRGRKRVPASEARGGGWSEAEGPKDNTACDPRL